MAQHMTGIEVFYPHHGVVRLDFEGLTERLGSSHAADIWDMVAKHGEHIARNGVKYRRLVPLIDRE